MPPFEKFPAKFAAGRELCMEGRADNQPLKERTIDVRQRVLEAAGVEFTKGDQLVSASPRPLQRNAAESASVRV
jgi:hypothetical protein